MTVFARLVAELDDPRCAKHPTRTFRAVVAALAELAAASTADIAEAAGVNWNQADPVLARLRRYGCATLTRTQQARGKHHGKVWTMTDLGHTLAIDLEQQQ